jgi:hypothetical protein
MGRGIDRCDVLSSLENEKYVKGEDFMYIHGLWGRKFMALGSLSSRKRPIEWKDIHSFRFSYDLLIIFWRFQTP